MYKWQNNNINWMSLNKTMITVTLLKSTYLTIAYLPCETGKATSLFLSLFISCADLELSHSFNHHNQQQHLHQNMESLSLSASGSITKLSSFAVLLVVVFLCSCFTSTGQCLQTCLLSVPCLQISCLGSVSLVFCFWVLVSYQRSVPFSRNLAVFTYN